LTAPLCTSTPTAPRRAAEWGGYIFNYARSEVRNFLVANALYWLGAARDGCGGRVASMLYLDYSARGRVTERIGGRENLEGCVLQEVNATVYAVPGWS